MASRPRAEPIRGIGDARFDPHAEIRRDLIDGPDADRPDRLHRARSGEDAVDRIARVEGAAAKSRGSDEVESGDDIRPDLAEIVSDDGFAARKGGAAELRGSAVG